MRDIVHPQWVSKGLNNYKLEFRNSALFAYAADRDLCTPDFVDGKTMGKGYAVPVNHLYNFSVFQKFVHIASATQCESNAKCRRVTECGSANPANATDLSLKQLKTLTVPYATSTCVTTRGCLNPTQLYARHVHMLLWQHLRKPVAILDQAAQIRRHLFNGTHYVALHWRFEEIKCKRAHLALGLCLRTTFRGTIPLTLADLATASSQICRQRNTTHLFLATDGRQRGFSALVNSFRSLMKERFGITVREAHDTAIRTIGALHGSTLRSELEQQIMVESLCAMGSPKSTWFTEVTLSRAVQENNAAAFHLAYETERNSPANELYYPLRKKLQLGSRLKDQPFVFLDDVLPLPRSEATVASDGRTRDTFT